MNVADCWKVCNYHGLFNGRKINYYSNEEQIMPIRKLFAGVLSFQLLAFADSFKKTNISSIPITILMQEDSPGQVSSPTSSGKNQISFCTSSSSGLSSHTDSNGVVHFPVPFSPAKGSRCGIKPRRCSLCHVEGKANSGGWARHSCNVCNKAFCCPSV
jgi:hypothetical protein